ncbi:MAG: MerR family transcriptional regulator [Lentisphaeria bacterium]|nr:MerR family transcriptional regulator [Lentisphaeria bacterium]
MTEKKVYLVSDLSAELGVPRTTINDWLKRFDRYLPSEMTGRRRAYTASALEVLKTVNRLRNEGMSVSKIDSELEKLYAIRPEEVQPENKSVATAESDGKESAPAVREEQDESVTPSLPALRREEFDRFVSSLEEFSRHEKSRRRGALYVWLIIMLLAVFSIVTAWYMMNLLKLQAASNSKISALARANAEAQQSLERERKENRKFLTEQKKEIAALKKSIAKSDADHRRELESERKKLRVAASGIAKEISALRREQKDIVSAMQTTHKAELDRRDQAIKKAEKENADRSKTLIEREKELKKLRQEQKELLRQLEELKKTKKKAPAQPGKEAKPAV